MTSKSQRFGSRISWLLVLYGDLLSLDPLPHLWSSIYMLRWHSACSQAGILYIVLYYILYGWSYHVPPCLVDPRNYGDVPLLPSSVIGKHYQSRSLISVANFSLHYSVYPLCQVFKSSSSLSTIFTARCCYLVNLGELMSKLLPT